MYIIQCKKTGVCDFELADGTVVYGASFRESDYIATNGDAVRKLKGVMMFDTKKDGQEFISCIETDFDDAEPSPKFKPIAVIISLK